ncbi:MAG: phage integrase N-terminal SAM-like domain-containing protein [Bryobacteraceae bacterium]
MTSPSTSARHQNQAGLDEIRQYQLHLLEHRKLEARTVCHHTSALRFFFVKVLKRPYPVEELPYPRARGGCRSS